MEDRGLPENLYPFIGPFAKKLATPDLKSTVNQSKLFLPSLTCLHLIIKSFVEEIRLIYSIF
jgi:hypothetical protein